MQSYTFHRGRALVKVKQLVGRVEIRRPFGGRWADKVRQMNSMPNPKQIDPHDVAVAALKQAYEQIGRADKQLPRGDKQVSKLEQNAARHASDQQKRIAVPGRQSSRGKLALQGLIGLLLAACVGAAAIAWQSHGDAAKAMFARWAPQSDLTSSLAPKNLVPAKPNPPAVQASTARAEHPQPARDLAAMEQEIEQLKGSIEQLKISQEQMTRDNVAVAEQLKAAQTQMARDNAAVAEQLKASQEQMARDNAAVAEQLKASQEQMARDNAAVAEQLKASQEQMARLIAKASEQNLRPKIAPPPRPTATPMPKRGPMLLSPQATARPQATTQLQPEGPQWSSAPRPPRPE